MEKTRETNLDRNAMIYWMIIPTSVNMYDQKALIQI